MEFSILSGLLFLYAIYLFFKPSKKSSKILEAEAESYFFNKSELTENRVINGVYTRGIGFYKNDKNDKITAVRQAKLCDLSII